MAGAQAINGFDPYFLQAYNSPSLQQLQQLQQGQQTQQTQQATQAQQGTNVSNSIFQGSVPRVQETEKKNHTAAWWILGAAAIAGTAWMITRKGILNQFVEGIKSFSKKSGKQIFTFADKNGHKYCSIPGKENVLKNSATVVDDLAQLGFDKGIKLNPSELVTTLDDGTTKLAEGISIKKGSFKIGNGTVTFEGDKIVSYVDDKGRDIMSRYLDPEKVARYAEVNNNYKKLIDEFMAGLKDGKKLNEISGLEVEHLYDDVTRIFTRQNPTDEFAFQQAITNRFKLNSTAVDAYRVDHPEISEILSKFEKGESNIGQILKAEFDGGKVGTILIENGTVVGVKTPTGEIFRSDSDNFKSLLYHNRKVFDTVMDHENQFFNIVRAAA